MAVRTTVDIPEPLHELLAQRSKAVGTSIRALIVRAIEDAYRPPRKGAMVSEALIKGRRLGPAFPTDETPYDLILP